MAGHRRSENTVTGLLTPTAQLRLAADRMRDWRFHCWYWGDAIAMDGLMEADELGVGDYKGDVLECLRRWLYHCPANFDDVLAPGALVIRLVMEGLLPAQAAERLLVTLDGLPPVFGAIPALEPHRPAFRYGVCIDAIYHLPATYAEASRWRDDRELARKAVQVAVDAMKVLRCKAGWAQWYDPTRRGNNDVAWTRGMGWAILGLLDLVRILEGRGTDEVAELAAQVLLRLAQTQRADGHWGAVLDHPAADPETSTAAFFVAAALHPVVDRLVSLPADAIDRAIKGCHLALADDGTYSGVTADVLPSWDIHTYEHCQTEPSAWGQGAAVRAFAAIVRSRASTSRA